MNILQRGQRCALALRGGTLRVEIEASARGGQVLDASCFGLDGQGRLSDDRYFIFYNQKASSCGAISMPSDTAFEIDLARLPPHVRRLIFAVTVEDAGSMADLSPSRITLSEGGPTLAQFEFSGADFSVEKALMVAELYWKDGWRLAAVGQGFGGGLGALLRHFGGEEDSPAPDSTPQSPTISAAPSSSPPREQAPTRNEIAAEPAEDTVPPRLAERLVAGLKKYQPVLIAARSRDVNEADTVRIISDMLADMWGYDKYSEVTSEHGIKGTYCDIAIEIGGTVKLLLEAKAVGIELRENHVKQAVDYAANKGCDWVVLTNGVTWRLYKVAFTKPIENELVLQIDMLALNARNASHIESLSLFARESLAGPGLAKFHARRQATNKFTLAAILLSEPMLELLRREVRRLSPEARVPIAELREALMNDVLKREIIEGDKADAARKAVKKAASRALRTSRNASQ